jgi:DNA helicase II / ATP-dependent DNA helicase PcrA
MFGALARMEAKYSILMFYPEVRTETLFEIKHLLKHGIKVYLLSFDELDLIPEDVFYSTAIETGLLSLHLLRYSEEFKDKELTIFDGEYHDERILTFFENNSSFNKEQYIIEHETEQIHCIVKAGAGTGKTTTMINRLMFIKHMNIAEDLSSVVMITFTNEAATHMRGKVLELLKKYYDITKDQKYLKWMEETGNMFIGTIHSFAKEFLSTEGRQIGFSRSVQVRSYRHERRKLIERFIDQFSTEHSEVYQNFKYIPHYKFVRVFEAMVERIQNKSISDDRIKDIDFGEDIHGFHLFSSYVLIHVADALKTKKQVDDALELSDLISKLSTLQFLTKDQLTLTIRYLFVDEFQDTDETQVAFISWIVRMYSPQLMAVGDIKQSIYRFRGADYTAFNQLMLHLQTIDAQFEEFSLKKNYRSEPILLSQLNKLFSKWDKKVDKFHFDQSDFLVPVKEDTVHEGLSTLKLDQLNLQHILKRLVGGDLAILVRSNRQVLDTVKQVEEMGFFCEASVSGSFYRSIPVREFYLLIRRLTHSHVAKDRYLFHRSSYGDNELTISSVLQEFTHDKQQVFELLNSFDSEVFQKINWNHMSTLSALQEVIAVIKPHEIFRRRYYETLRERFPFQDQKMQQVEAIAKMKEYKVNLDQLIFFLKKEFGDFRASIFDLEKYLSIKMATDSTQTEWKLDNEISHRIKVMTVHKAKGLEFDYVIMPITDSLFIKNANNDLLLLPEAGKWKFGYKIDWAQNELINNHYRRFELEERNETVGEEARLLYVALTRAKKGVYANSTSTMNQYSAKCWNNLLENMEMEYV